MLTSVSDEPVDNTVKLAVVGGVFALLAALVPEGLRIWRESRDRRFQLERRIGRLEALNNVNPDDEDKGDD